ncbi:hypothetical protein JRQ81_009500 [Phrynocephalus forsythii]|uniref:RNA-binding protein 14 n=1 Tax=Phrynocephalus forsythii TaxID=171643 RepID=A0A9Q0X9W2_9SAUR|nr:hypothetical protein JRQ81_009500 [Phrynocephalus forsythii]
MASGLPPPPPRSGPGPARRRPVELLVDEIPPRTTDGDVLRLFTEVSEPGEVRGVVVLQGRGAVVRMRSEEGAERAAAKLRGRPFRGLRLSVRRFHTFKIFVGMLSPECTSQDLRQLFEEFGPVVECSIVKDYAFVHMENEEEARAAIEHLDGWEVKGKRIAVQASRVHKSSHNFKETVETKWNNSPAPSYRNPPPASHGVDYRAPPSTGHSVVHKDQRYGLHGDTSYQSKFSAPSRPPPAASARTSYGAQVASSHDRSYEARPARPSAHLWESYEDEVAFEDESFTSGVYPPSEQPVSYRSSYRAEDTGGMAATYKKLGNNGASYTLSDSLSTRGRTSDDANCGVQQPTKVPLASSYRAQPEHGGLIQPAPQDMSSLGSLPSETAAHHVPYERVRLSPPRAVHDDYYREFSAANKQYASKPGATAALHQRYEHVRLSPPRTSRREDPYYREASASKLRYASETETGALRRPYERVRLSPPCSSHSAKRRRDE